MPRNKRILISVSCFLVVLLPGVWWSVAGPLELSGGQRFVISIIFAMLVAACLFFWLAAVGRSSDQRQNPASAELDPSDLVANMGHELRTPLSGILGVMHLLKRTNLGIDQRRYVDTASNSANMLLNIINDVIARSRMDTGWLPIESEYFELAEIVEDVSSILTPEATDKGLQLVCDIDPGIPHRINGDALRLRQILNNFLHNAVLHTEQGVIAIYARRCAAGVEIGVKDTGIGIDAETCLRLQQSGTALDAGDTTETNLGFGLGNSRKLIEAMGSQLRIESEPGTGSRFYFELDVGPERAASYDWRAPKSFRELSVSILSNVELRRNSISGILLHWQIGKVVALDVDVDNGPDLSDLEPCDVLIIDQNLSEQAVNDLIQDLRNNATWRETFFIHLVPLNRVGEGGSADLQLYKPLSNTRLYAGLLGIVYKRAFNSEYDAGLNPYNNEALRILANHRILLVEDNDINQMIALEMLEETGLVVDVANNGADALEQVQREQYDLILMDILMPVMDGYEATRAIRALGGDYASIPVIAITAHALEGDSGKSLEAGMNYHISKPFEPDSLIAIITRFIEEQSQ